METSGIPDYLYLTDIELIRSACNDFSVRNRALESRIEKLEQCLTLVKSILDHAEYTVETPNEEKLFFKMADLGFIVQFDEWLRPNKEKAESLIGGNNGN